MRQQKSRPKTWWENTKIVSPIHKRYMNPPITSPKTTFFVEENLIWQQIAKHVYNMVVGGTCIFSIPSIKQVRNIMLLVSRCNYKLLHARMN